jgi:hypothetical protein
MLLTLIIWQSYIAVGMCYTLWIANYVLDTPSPKGEGFLLHPTLPLKAVPLDGLTRCPQAEAVCPTAKIRKPSSRIFRAAFMSLSWLLSQTMITFNTMFS